jgi:hypothetical protein
MPDQLAAAADTVLSPISSLAAGSEELRLPLSFCSITYAACITSAPASDNC